MEKNTQTSEYRPQDMPEVYASVCTGDCLEPTYSDGTCLVFSKTEQPHAGDFVGVWLHPDEVRPGEAQRYVKRLAMGLMPGLTFPYEHNPASEIEPMVMLEMLNPPRRLPVRASRVIAMHKVIGQAALNGGGTARILEEGVA